MSDSILSAAITLFLMMDSVGNVPVFSAMLKDVEPRRRSAVVIRENLIALVTLLFFLMFGPTVMGLLHIQTAALGTAGGIVLFIVSLGLIFPERRPTQHDTVVTAEPFIVPLAIPLTAGPATMAVLMLMATQQPHRRGDWTLALLLAWSCGLVVLLLANRLRAVLGPRGLLAIERLMGMILLVLAVQMTMNGLKAFLHP